MVIYIYAIQCMVTNKYYIGQTRNLKQRWKTHSSGKTVRLLSAAIKKYGIDTFEFEIIDQTDNENSANMLEENYIIQYNSLAPNGYNLASKASQARISKIPDDMQQYIIQEYLRSERTVKEISDEIGWSCGAIAKTLDRHNVERRDHIIIHPRADSKLDKTVLRKMLLDGILIKDIAAHFNTTYKYIWKYAKTHKLEEYNTRPKRDRNRK